MSLLSLIGLGDKKADYSMPQVAASEAINYHPEGGSYNQVPVASSGNNSNYTIDELASLLGGMNKSSSGVTVTPENAFRVAAVYACIDRIAGTIKSLPFHEYKRIDDMVEKVDSIYDFMFNMRAYDEMTSSDAWQFMFVSKFLRGDGFAELIRPNYRSSEVVGWRPIHPDDCFPFHDSDNVKRYLVTRPNGTQETLNTADVVQITSLGYDGLTSPSPITYAGREAIGNAIAAQNWMGKFFEEGAQFDFALSTDKRMSEKQIKDLTAVLIARIQSNGRAPLLLSGGLEPKQLTINPKDAQILESRQFGLLDVCRIFGVPPHLIGHTEKSTTWGSGLEELGAGFVRYTLMPHMKQAQQEFSYRIHHRKARQRFFEFDTHELVRGDIKTRFDAYRVAIGRAGEPGFMTPEEVRTKENLPAVPEKGTLTTGVSDDNASHNLPSED